MTAPAGPIREVELPGFEEGAHVHQHDGWFHLAHGYRTPQRVAYARAAGARTGRGRSPAS